YQCRVEDSDGVRDWHAHDRGANIPVMSADKKPYRLMLLRAPLPDVVGEGMHDQLRLALLPLDSEQPIIEVSAAPIASATELDHVGVKVRCNLAKGLPPMHVN
ncbi:MAG: hypothetical protein ACO3P5_07220, partial [Steroidobacteraceae bacterium]